jgi:hypothetical protein
MQRLELKATHKPVQNYYATLRQFDDLGVTHETAVRSAFHGLLDYCARQDDWTLVPEWVILRPRQHPLREGGALLDNFRLTHGYWEAKDIRDDLPKEARKKFDLGYPRDNILFQTPRRALLFQNDTLAFDADLTRPPALIDALNAFFSYTPPAYTEWERAVSEFRDRVPELARNLIEHATKVRRKKSGWGGKRQSELFSPIYWNSRAKYFGGESCYPLGGDAIVGEVNNHE